MGFKTSNYEDIYGNDRMIKRQFNSGGESINKMKSYRKASMGSRTAALSLGTGPRAI
jgi:hypothetical protein